MGAISGAGSPYPSGSPEITLVFCGISIAQSYLQTIRSIGGVLTSVDRAFEPRSGRTNY